MRINTNWIELKYRNIRIICIIGIPSYISILPKYQSNP